MTNACKYGSMLLYVHKNHKAHSSTDCHVPACVRAYIRACVRVCVPRCLCVCVCVCYGVNNQNAVLISLSVSPDNYLVRQ